jgi:hypothetical protein
LTWIADALGWYWYGMFAVAVTSCAMFDGHGFTSNTVGGGASIGGAVSTTVESCTGASGVLVSPPHAATTTTSAASDFIAP